MLKATRAPPCAASTTDGHLTTAAVDAGLDYKSIRGAEKILEPGEDWRVLGTDEDPVVQEALGSDAV
jgi:phthalate 4,5-dioxygenase